MRGEWIALFTGLKNMGEDYKCDVCGAPATVHLTQIVNGKMHKMHLCEKCMEKSKVAELPILKFTEMLAQTLALKKNTTGQDSEETETLGQTPALKCPVCGMTDIAFEKKQCFGCANCYNVFSEKIIDLLPKIQRGKAYQGDAMKNAKKQSKRTFAKKIGTPIDLKTQLKEAVAKEDYALAAQLRDALRTLEDNRKKTRPAPAKTKEKVKSSANSARKGKKKSTEGTGHE